MVVTPYFAIITATRNAATNLSRLLESLAMQTCRDFELIIQDGASTDDTVAVAEAWRERLPALSIVSETDAGIYDAWNKALSRIRGEWALFLGADDELADADVLAQAKERMRAYPPQVLFAAGDMTMCRSDGSVMQEYRTQAEKGVAYLPQGSPLPYPALFQRGSLFVSHVFDTRFRIAGDYDFLCRTWKRENQAERLGFCVTRMIWGGISTHPRTVFAMRWEDTRVTARYFPWPWTLRRIRGLVQGAVIGVLCAILGSRGAGLVLDRLRVMRGLPPCWGSDVRPE